MFLVVEWGDWFCRLIDKYSYLWFGVEDGKIAG